MTRINQTAALRHSDAAMPATGRTELLESNGQSETTLR